MEQIININQIVSEIERLNYHDKINIMARIVQLLKKEEGSIQKTSIVQLKGLGKEVWKGMDVANYVEEERRSWD